MAGKRYAFMIKVLKVMCELCERWGLTAVNPWHIIQEVGKEKEDQVYIVLRKLVQKGLVRKEGIGTYVVDRKVCESLSVLEALLS